MVSMIGYTYVAPVTCCYVEQKMTQQLRTGSEPAKWIRGLGYRNSVSWLQSSIFIARNKIVWGKNKYVEHAFYCQQSAPQ